MSNYDIFAMYYDSLTKNVDYAGRADYISELLRRHNHDAGITLDLACGTGSLTLELYKRGYDVYGIDNSMSMLSVAKDKTYDEGADILFLCQNMQNLDLYGTVNTVICALDSINHLSDAKQIFETFKKVSLFMEPGGYFIFDFNTPYKHLNVLRDRVFIYDTPDVYCVWKNRINKETLRVNIDLDFFGKVDKLYDRSSERFSEITYETDFITDLLRKAGFDEIEVFDDMTFEPQKEKSERITFCCRKGDN
ncbi:MAG: class I SAM-dependent methyltransferase [Clostridia bacterium]|nr:class I SAM-dependent methyltransferase [Clostridia bacterium]